MAVVGLISAPVFPAAAALYNGSAGYQYTTGDRGYWGHDFLGYGNVRLEGGWYPFGQLGILTDSFYDWVAAPGAGIEKGFAGVGKLRAGYTLYEGHLRDANLDASAHTLEFGMFRALTPEFSADAAYRFTTGNLFAGVNRDLDVASGVTRTSLRYSVVHQGILSLSWQPENPLHVQFDGSLSAGTGSGNITYTSESLGASAPVVHDLRAHISYTHAGAAPGGERNYFGIGAFYSFAGKIKEQGKTRR